MTETPPERSPDDDLATAHHEAGHGVVAYRLDHYVKSLTIVRDHKAGTEGLAITEESDPENEVVILFAGGAAERRFAPDRDLSGCCDDERQAADLLANLPDGTESRLREEARRSVDANWSAIEAVAAALVEHGTLDGDWSIIVDAVDEGADWRKALAGTQWMREQP